MLARYFRHRVTCLCRLSLRLSNVGVLLRRLHLGSRKQRHTTARDSDFLTPKISAIFQLGHPQRGRQIEVGRFKSAILDQYLAITQKRCKIGTYLLWKANSNLYALCRIALFLMTFGDPNYPQNNPVFHILYALLTLSR